MDQAAEPVPAQNPDAGARIRRTRTFGRWALLQRLVLLAIGYVISCGLAQSGSREHYNGS
jgi:hypothetical protein